MKHLRTLLQFLLPIAVLAAGALLAWMVVQSRQQPIVTAPERAGPLVRVMEVTPTDAQLDVLARGVVEPLRTVDLAAEVGGRIVATHPALRAGGSFTPNDVLVEIDPTDYRLAITQQKAAVARAELRLAQERAEAEAAQRAWQKLEGEREADPLVLREPQIRDAELAVEAAKAQLERAETDLARTKVQLPFSGRVRSVRADIGQTVQRGQQLAVVLDTTAFEVRLPIPQREAGFVDLPLQGSVDDGPATTLTAQLAGAERTWSGRVTRIEGEVDRRTRQLTAIARVSGGSVEAGAPLLAGMFVEARIEGRHVTDVLTVPRSALHEGDRVWVVVPEGARDDDGVALARLQLRPVDVLRLERDRAVLRGGLRSGELVLLSTLDAVVDGMAVRVAARSGDQAGAAEEK